jgi:hypothetical protein
MNIDCKSKNDFELIYSDGVIPGKGNAVVGVVN